MLRIVVRLDLIAEVQRHYRERDTYDDLATADLIRQMRLFIEAGARRFEERQRSAQKNGKPYLRDGRAETLDAELFGPLARNGWPSRAGGILHGLRLRDRVAMSRLGDPATGSLVSPHDPHSYWTLLQDGPDQARSFGPLVAIVVYLDPLESLNVLWIGPELDALEAWHAMLADSKHLADWSRLSPAYAEWLAANP